MEALQQSPTVIARESYVTPIASPPPVEDQIRRLFMEYMAGVPATSRFPFFPSQYPQPYPLNIQPPAPLGVQIPPPLQVESPSTGASSTLTFEQWMMQRPKVTLQNLSEAMHLLKIRFPAEQQAIREEINKIYAEWASL